MKKTLLLSATVLLMTSCGSKLGNLTADNFTVVPNPLEAQMGNVPATINATFPEKYMNKKAVITVTPELRFEKNGTFGLAFDYNGRTDKYKTITLDPSGDTLALQFNEGSTLITETPAEIEPGKDYTFTYVQEGSVGIFTLDGIASLTVRLYGVSGKPVRLFTENNTVTVSDLKQYTR